MESNPIPNLKPNESKSDTLEIKVALFFLNQFQLGVKEKSYHLGE